MNAPFAPLRGGIVQVLAPAGFTTGGPEALHQLAAAVDAAGEEARMVYLGAPPAGRIADALRPDGTPERYRGYRTRAATAFRDDPRDVVVFPEVWSSAIHRVRRARRVLWWLSVDNNVMSPLGRYFSGRVDPRVGHAYQSAYARSYLASNGVEQAHPLRDYLSAEYLAAPPPVPHGRADRVLFNPKKGAATTAALAIRARERGLAIEFSAIENVTATQVVERMRTSKVYIDFGTHPGMDRLPREAAMCGLAVITGSSGAAGWDEDTPLPSGFRFADWEHDAVLDAIVGAFADFATVQARFDGYRSFIRAQPAEFARDAAALFGGAS